MTSSPVPMPRESGLGSLNVPAEILIENNSGAHIEIRATVYYKQKGSTAMGKRIYGPAEVSLVIQID